MKNYPKPGDHTPDELYTLDEISRECDKRVIDKQEDREDLMNESNSNPRLQTQILKTYLDSAELLILKELLKAPIAQKYYAHTLKVEGEFDATKHQVREAIFREVFEDTTPDKLQAAQKSAEESEMYKTHVGDVVKKLTTKLMLNSQSSEDLYSSFFEDQDSKWTPEKKEKADEEYYREEVLGENPELQSQIERFTQYFNRVVQQIKLRRFTHSNSKNHSNFGMMIINMMKELKNKPKKPSPLKDLGENPDRPDKAELSHDKDEDSFNLFGDQE